MIFPKDANILAGLSFRISGILVHAQYFFFKFPILASKIILGILQHVTLFKLAAS
jgi:hypothetical protein